MRKNSMTKYFCWLLVLISLTSCSKFSKLQKNGTEEEKYQAALEYYGKADYYKAGILFEEIAPTLKGGTESELVQFYNAYCQFHQGMYNMSQFLFKKFYDTYARSDKAQEALFMHAFSLYKDSPPYNLDQTNTMTAISALQDIVNTYPTSPFNEECTRYILELRDKLELKAYEKARLYYKISEFNLYSLKSAVVAIENFRKDFPDSKYNEELSFLRVDAQYNYAKSSLTSKQKERFEQMNEYYVQFVDKYPNSKFLREAEKQYTDSQKELERLAVLEKQIQEMRDKAKEKSDAPGRVTTSEPASEEK
jgi:outer membrane protein assembly factor BamD